MLGVGGDNFSTGQEGCGNGGGCGKDPGSSSKDTFKEPRPLKPMPCWLVFFTSDGERSECRVGDNSPDDMTVGEIRGGLPPVETAPAGTEVTVDTLTVNGCVGVLHVGSLINGLAERTGSRDESSMPLDMLSWSMTVLWRNDGVGVVLSMPLFWRFIILSGSPVSGSIWKFAKDGGTLWILDDSEVMDGDADVTCKEEWSELELISGLCTDVDIIGVWWELEILDIAWDVWQRLVVVWCCWCWLEDDWLSDGNWWYITDPCTAVIGSLRFWNETVAVWSFVVWGWRDIPCDSRLASAGCKKGELFCDDCDTVLNTGFCSTAPTDRGLASCRLTVVEFGNEGTFSLRGKNCCCEAWLWCCCCCWIRFGSCDFVDRCVDVRIGCWVEWATDCVDGCWTTAACCCNDINI